MNSELEKRCADLVGELQLGAPAEVTGVQPLTGGVASDIARFELGATSYCAKFALAKLKVAEDWRAPVHRNRAEYHWLQVAAAIEPQSAIRLFGHSVNLNGFVMEYVSGENVHLWKTELLAGNVIPEAAARVGDLLGRIHAASTESGFDATAFDNHDDFRALRIEPYLNFTATVHQSVAGKLNHLAEMLDASSKVLVHGDVSPKNILFRDGHPLLLDAECASMGDASFDPAFCLNHLLLKAIHLDYCGDQLLTSVHRFWQAYRQQVSWESVSDLEARVCALICALMLARVDGKSPVEYLSPSECDLIRNLALRLNKQAPQTLQALTDHIGDQLKGGLS